SLAAWNLARVYLEQDDYEQAELLLGQAIALGKALDTPYELCDYLYTSAELAFRQRHYPAAQAFNDEAARSADQVDHQEIRFETQLLALRLRLALRQLEGPIALQVACEQLLAHWTEPKEQAAIYYLFWQACGEDGGQAAALYRELYASTPNIIYRQRYHEL